MKNVQLQLQLYENGVFPSWQSYVRGCDIPFEIIFHIQRHTWKGVDNTKIPSFKSQNQAEKVSYEQRQNGQQYILWKTCSLEVGAA